MCIMKFDIRCFEKKIICEGNCTDTVVETVVKRNVLDLYVSATEDCLKFIELTWKFESNGKNYVLGDVRERS